MRWALVAEAPAATIDSKADLPSVHQHRNQCGGASQQQNWSGGRSRVRLRVILSPACCGHLATAHWTRGAAGIIFDAGKLH